MTSTSELTKRSPVVKTAAVVTHGHADTKSALEHLRTGAEKAGVTFVDDPRAADLVVVLGGDGTMLRTLALLLGSAVPVIGVNFGRVGFLASIRPADLIRDLARVFAGEYGGATEVSGYAAVYFNSQLGLEGALGQYLGRYSNGVTGDIGLIHVFAPEWRASPFVTLGLGLVRIQPKATLVQAPDRTEDTAYAGIGVRYYLTRRFFVRAEYKTHYIFTTRNANQEEDEWKLGFAFFF